MSSNQHLFISLLNINHTTQQGLTISLNSPEPNDDEWEFPYVDRALIRWLWCSQSGILIKHIQESSVAKAEHKYLKIKSKLASIEFKDCLNQDKHEHMLQTATEHLELEIKLKQVKLECLALEREMSCQSN